LLFLKIRSNVINIKAIQEYYVYPNDSQLSPFDGQLLVLNSEYGKKLLLGLAVEAADNRTMDTIRAKTTEYGIFIFDHHDINDIAAYLEEKQKFNNYADLETKSIDAFNAIEDVLTEKHTRENKIYFGYWLAIFSEKNGEGISGKTFQGLSLSVAKDEYDNSKQYPIKDLNTTIIDRKLELKKREEFKAPIDRLEALQSEITKSSIEIDILNAHDDIRKMLGKPIYYALGNPTDFDTINNAMDIIKKEYNIDLMGMEIENIVNDFDSYTSLSNKYGISEDAIYHVKALFR